MSVGDVILKTLETVWRGLVITLSLIALASISLFVWLKIGRPIFFPPLESKIVATATFDDGKIELPPVVGAERFRCSPDFPIKVTFLNESSVSVGKISFAMEGRASNRTDNVLERGSWLDTDSLIPAGYIWSGCWSASAKEGFSLRDLNYSIEVLRVTKAEKGISFQPKSLAPRRSEGPPGEVNSTENTRESMKLGMLDDSAWSEIGMGCACAFSTGSSRTLRLLAGGDDLLFFRLNGEGFRCPAPDTQSLFSEPLNISCGSASVKVSPYSEPIAGGDGHSSDATLQISNENGEISLQGIWECSC